MNTHMMKAYGRNVLGGVKKGDCTGQISILIPHFCSRAIQGRLVVDHVFKVQQMKRFVGSSLFFRVVYSKLLTLTSDKQIISFKSNNKEVCLFIFLYVSYAAAAAVANVTILKR